MSVMFMSSLKLQLEKSVYKIYKTGIPFYDAARLVGAAHLFFGTASAEVQDFGAYWEISGINIQRDEDQINWILERLRNLTSTEKNLFKNKKGKFAWKELSEYFAEPGNDVPKKPLKMEYDAALQIGTRGIDPISKYEVLAPRSTGEKKKKCFDACPEVAVATLGRGFAATVVSRASQQTDTTYILPIFSDHFVLSGLLEFQRYYQHPAGGNVASVLAAISILLELTPRKIPVIDFVYNREVTSGFTPIFSESGYLGFEKLCTLWLDAVKNDNIKRLSIFRQIRLFLNNTSRPNITGQNMELARQLARFVVRLDVNSLALIARLKARILASSKNFFPALNLFRSYYDIAEVGKMMETNVEIPKRLAETVAGILSLEGKGWMNKLTKLENASTMDQFLTEIERLVSRGAYTSQAKNQEIDLSGVRDIERYNSEELQKFKDSRTFRSFKSLFLLTVLGKMEIKQEQQEGGE